MLSKTNQAINYWWVVASENNPNKQWHWKDFFRVPNKVGETYKWGGPDWISSTVSFARIKEMREGDVVIAYQAAEGVVGLVFLASDGYKYVQSGNYDTFDLEATPKVWLDTKIPLSEIQKLPDAKKNIEFVRFHQGTVFRVTENGYNSITKVILKFNPNLRKQIHEFLLLAKGTDEAEVVAADDDNELKTPRKQTTTYQRIIRNSKIGSDLKKMYQYKCQVCGDTIKTNEGKLFAEIHHLQPVGKPHNGKDGTKNTIVVCPQHHAMFDSGVIAINPISFEVEHWNPQANEHGTKLILKHTLDQGCLEYHYNIFKPTKS